MLPFSAMETLNTQDLARQVKEKAAELQAMVELMDRYARNIGPDRWYNRACHDITTLRAELAGLEKRLAAAQGEA